MSSVSPRRMGSPKVIQPKKKLELSKQSPQFDPFNTSRRTQSKPSPNPNQSLNRSRTNPSFRKETKSSSNLRNIKFSSEMDTIIDQVSSNKAKLSSFMEIFQMILSSVQTLRCLQHNNALSLYCLNERKILCVNCIYGAHKHRSHKVVPLKDCLDRVRDDNLKLNSIIQEQLIKMQNYAKISDQNSHLLQQQMNKLLVQIQQQYNQKVDQLKQRHQRSKKFLFDSFSLIINKSNQAKKVIQDFKFNTWKAYTMFKDRRQKQTDQIMKQMLFVNIVEMTQFSNRIITKTELDSITRKIKQNWKES